MVSILRYKTAEGNKCELKNFPKPMAIKMLFISCTPTERTAALEAIQKIVDEKGGA